MSVCVCVHLIGFGLQVFEVFVGSRQTLVVSHVPLHHLIIRVFQQEGVGSRHRLGQVVRLGGNNKETLKAAALLYILVEKMIQLWYTMELLKGLDYS